MTTTCHTLYRIGLYSTQDINDTPQLNVISIGGKHQTLMTPCHFSNIVFDKIDLLLQR